MVGPLFVLRCLCSDLYSLYVTYLAYQARQNRWSAVQEMETAALSQGMSDAP